MPCLTWPVADDVVGHSVLFVNLYMIGPRGAGNRQWVLVDAGLPLSAGRIRNAAAERFGPGSRPAAIILTHGHFDHVGALGTLADEWDAPVYCHPPERPYLDGRSPYPPPDPSVRGLMAFMSRLYPRGPFNVADRLQDLPADGTVPDLPGWQWIWTPGHAPGHVSLFRERDRLLIAGDAFVTVAQESAWSVLTQEPRLSRPPAYFTPDWASAHRSVQELAALGPETAVTGHGAVMRGEQLRSGLQSLLTDWDEQAVPVHGRYSQRPALITAEGFISAPPPVFDYRLPVALGAGALLANSILRKRK